MVHNTIGKRTKRKYGWPCGPMDKASDYESGDCRFESCQGQNFSSWYFFVITKMWTPPGGLEPPTFRLTAERASQLRHGGLCLSYSKQNQNIWTFSMWWHIVNIQVSWSRCCKTCLPAPPMFPGFISRHWYTYRFFFAGTQYWNFALKWTNKQNSSHAGSRTRAPWVKARYPSR